MADQLSLGMTVSPRWTNPNPAVARWGFGPEGKRCLDCTHLLRRPSNTKAFFKCAKRGEVEGISHGPKTDHKRIWESCKKFEDRPKGAT